jgi:hypothetical protein
LHFPESQESVEIDLRDTMRFSAQAVGFLDSKIMNWMGSIRCQTAQVFDRQGCVQIKEMTQPHFGPASPMLGQVLTFLPLSCDSLLRDEQVHKLLNTRRGISD